MTLVHEGFSHVSIDEATHIQVDGVVKKIAFRCADGVTTEDGQFVSVMKSQVYLKDERQ